MPIINITYGSRERPHFDPQALVAVGPQITIDILPPSIVERWAQERGIAPPPSAMHVPALIDTGASITGIDEEILQKLQYPPIGVAPLATPSGTSQTSIYMVRLVIPSRADPEFPPGMPRIVLDNVRVIAVRLSSQAFRVLLGRDVLSRMILVYNGPQAMITLGY